MARVISTTTIHQTVEPGVAKTKDAPGKKPVVRVIKAGTIMHVSGEWEKELRAANAIRDLQKGETVAVDPNTLPIYVESDADAEARVAASQKATKAKSTSTKSSGKKKADEDNGLGAGDGGGADADLV